MSGHVAYKKIKIKIKMEKTTKIRKIFYSTDFSEVSDPYGG